MKTSLLLWAAFTMAIFSKGYGQRQPKPSTKIKSKIDTSFFYLKREKFSLPVKINDDLYEFIRDEETLSVFKNGKIFIDTLKENRFSVRLEHDVIISNDKMYLVGIDYSGKYNRIGLYEFDPAMRTFEFKVEKNFQGTFNDNFYFTDDGLTVSYYDNKDFKKTDLISFQGLIKPNYGVYELYSFGGTNKILAMTGRGDDDYIDDAQYFLVDIPTKKVTEVTAKIPLCTREKNDPSYYNYRVDQELSSCFPNSLVIYRESCVEHRNPMVVDLDLNIVTEILNRPNAYYGNFYLKGKKAGAFSRNFTDALKEVFILSEPNLKLEIAFKKIFDSILLAKADISGLSQYNLDLLKNFVYAKHNYKFLDEYYQVYFNQFTFYNEEKKTRISEVSHLFTNPDKRNLELISTLLKAK
jgi:hypothetical protein